MKIVYILTLVTLLLALPVANAQDNRLPPCSSADIAYAQSLEGDATRLVILAATIESMDELLRFGAEQLAWRDKIWTKLPYCNDVMAYGLALEQLSETLVMKLLLQSAGVNSESNPYVELGLESAKEVNRLERIFADADNVDDAAATTALPACSAEERVQLTGDFWTGIVNLVDTLHAVDSFEALLGYIDATLAWRSGVWSTLPPCAEAYDIAVWKAHFTVDIAKLYMLDLFDVARADNPYGKTYLTGIVQFSDYMQWIDTTGWDYRSLPACAYTSISQGLHQAVRSYQDWSERPHETVADLPAFADAHIAWRETLLAALPALPGCREAVEAALLAIQIAGDTAAIAALSLTDIELNGLGDAFQQRIAGAGDRLEELNGALESAPSDEARQVAVALPACSDRDLNILFDDLQRLGQLQQQAFDLQRTDELIVYIQDYFAWRDQLWRALPGCAEVFQIAAVMLQMLGDYATNIAMVVAGAPEDALPYHAQTERAVDVFNQWQLTVWAPGEEPAPTPGPFTTYYVIANGSAPLYECASSDCEIRALVAEGEPLRVVDDSGEWYKAYIGAGVYGYVQRELTSATPPEG